MKDFDLRKYLAEGRLFENTINQISSRIVKLGKEAGISSDDIEEYVDGLESSFEPDAYKNITDKELLKDLKLAVEYLEEGKLLKEEKGINYLKDAFETYLAGGDTFTNKPGKTETVKFKNDGSLIPKNKFEVALQSLPTTVKVDVYKVNFKKVGDNIVGTFKIK